MMRTMTCFALASAAAAVPGAPQQQKTNMNGEYAVTSVGDVDTDYNTDYASKGYDYFDVWGPEIATRYGEVFWTDQGVTPLPADIVKKFDGKVMAIMGYEQDQVMVEPVGHPGVNPAKDTSVPINWAYNHHYMAWMVGKHSEMKEMPIQDDSYAVGAHGKSSEMRAVDKADQSGRGFADVAPAGQMFSEGNGGESRKSFHGYPAKHAQLIESPTGWHITPMQIDTRNRDHGVTAADVHTCTNMTECRGYEPRNARFGRNGNVDRGKPGKLGVYDPPIHDARNPQGYSGILECPCNSRFGGGPMIYPGADTKKGTGQQTQLCNTAHFGNNTPCKVPRITHCEEHGIMQNPGECAKPFGKRCVGHDSTLGADGKASGDLVAQANPTCSSENYIGGLSCCQHGRIMLDADQTKNDDGPLLKYHMKWRFWIQEYVPGDKIPGTNKTDPKTASHLNLPRIYFQTEANAGEYDIPPAFYVKGEPKINGYPDIGPYPELSPGTTCSGSCPSGDDCECEHTITYNHTSSNAMRLIYAGGHCHAPACLGIWLYRNDPGHEMELLCHQAPIYGKGTLKNSKAGIYDEAGYLALPPCLWGNETNPEKGLHPSVLLPKGTPLVSIKKNRNTNSGHYGEMASWQMRGVSF